MELNQSTLRGILAAILSVDQKYIVPKQGNWFNPQEMLPAVSRPATWCAYRIASNKPRTAPYYSPEGNVNRVLVQKIANIELQFVGTQSETLAQSVAFWSLRADVKKHLESVGGAILYDDITAFSSNFFQEGANSVLAWNTTFRVLWIASINTSQDVIKNWDTGGYING